MLVTWKNQYFWDLILPKLFFRFTITPMKIQIVFLKFDSSKNYIESKVSLIGKQSWQ